MQKFIDGVIERWKENGKESNTYIALRWLQARIAILESERDATEAGIKRTLMEVLSEACQRDVDGIVKDEN